jgi:TonB family protein
MPDWKSCEGQLLDGKYRLERYVSGSEGSALFFIGSVSAAVRLRRADAAEAAALVARWNRSKILCHPHLLAIHAAGISVLAGEPVAYVVMEQADEDLPEILEERSLTADEASEMLLQVASALEYLHSRGLTHADLRPSNILAFGNTVKLSSDSVREGDPETDIRALGLTLIDALAARGETLARDDRGPSINLPAPFGEIAEACLHRDPELRWTVDKIVARLRSPADSAASFLTCPAPADRPRSKRPMLRRFAAPVGLAVAGAAVLVGVKMRHTNHSSLAVSQPGPLAVAVSPGQPPATTTAESKALPRTLSKSAVQSRDRMVIGHEITQRVIPSVPQKALDTIEGKPVVVVRVSVDRAGDVTDAVVERSFSPYFSKFALDAARQWKFAAAKGEGVQEWILRFQFTRTKTEVVPYTAGK